MPILTKYSYLFYYTHILLFQLPFNILTYPFPWMNSHIHVHRTLIQLVEVDLYIFLITEHNYKKKNNLKIKLSRKAKGKMEWPNKTKTSLSLIHFNGGNELYAVFLWNISLFLAVYSLFATIDDGIKFQTLSQWITSRCLSLQTTDGFFLFHLIKVGPIYAQVLFFLKLKNYSHNARMWYTHSLLCNSFYTTNKFKQKWTALLAYSFEEIHISTMVKSLKCVVNTSKACIQCMYVGMYVGIVYVCICSECVPW